MANPNVERVYSLLAAYMRGDEEKLRVSTDPGAETYGAPGIVNAGTYHGYDGFLQWSRQWEEAWDEISYELLEMIEVRESIVVVPVHAVGRGAGSGVEIDTVFGWMYEFRDGLVTRFHVYPTVDEAVDAARRLAVAQP
jgi:ketosteroid isomerase-like protein